MFFCNDFNTAFILSDDMDDVNVEITPQVEDNGGF